MHKSVMVWLACLIVAVGVFAVSCGSGSRGHSTPIGPPGPAPGPVPPPGNSITVNYDTNWKFFANSGTQCLSAPAGINLEAEAIEYAPGKWALTVRPPAPTSTCMDGQSVVFTGTNIGGTLAMDGVQGSTHCLWFDALHGPGLAGAPAILKLQNGAGFLTQDGRSFSIAGSYTTELVGAAGTVLCSGRFELSGARRAVP